MLIAGGCPRYEGAGTDPGKQQARDHAEGEAGRHRDSVLVDVALGAADHLGTPHVVSFPRVIAAGVAPVWVTAVFHAPDGGGGESPGVGAYFTGRSHAYSRMGAGILQRSTARLAWHAYGSLHVLSTKCAAKVALLQ